ncbi:MAG: hypothetical protein FJ033_08335 [Chloroflexi bacterium]|nr:hypothetical protein [Chloroflexota bacterium]
MSLTKTASPATVIGESKITYTVAITNGGTSNLDLGNITDTLPTGFGYVTGSTTFNGVSISDPTTSAGSASAQGLTRNLSGAAIGAGLTRNLAYQVAIVSGTSGARTNSVTVNGTYNTVSYSRTGSESVTVTVASSAAQRLWGTTLTSRGPKLSGTSNGTDSGFNDSCALLAADDWPNDANSQEGFIWTVVDNTTFTTSITSAKAVIRFGVGTLHANDMFVWQICVAATSSLNENWDGNANWATIRSFGQVQDQMPPEGTFVGSLATIAVDVSSTVNTVAKANNAQFRVVGKGKSGSADVFGTCIDEVARAVSGS